LPTSKGRGDEEGREGKWRYGMTMGFSLPKVNFLLTSLVMLK